MEVIGASQNSCMLENMIYSLLVQVCGCGACKRWKVPSVVVGNELKGLFFVVQEHFSSDIFQDTDDISHHLRREHSNEE